MTAFLRFGLPCRVMCGTRGARKSGLLACVLLLVLGHAPCLAADVSDLKSDETIVLFPSAGWLDESADEWHVPIHGWVFEPESGSRSRRLVVNQFQEALGLNDREAAGERFQRRVRAFVVDNERGKRIVVKLGERQTKLAASTANGHFQETIRIPAAEVQGLIQQQRLTYEVVLAKNDRRNFAGQVLLIPPRGVSIVSDIDDTVKITQVGDKRRVLENTFVKPFRAVEGMATVYREWSEAGRPLHWVSASPWQLYEPLSEFITAERFPTAAWHLKSVRLADTTVMRLLDDPEDSKVATISAIIQQYPQRTFILIGDSGERDPEAYGRLAQTFPQRITRIWIRDVTNEARDAPRYGRCWSDLPPDLARVFQTPADLRK